FEALLLHAPQGDGNAAVDVCVVAEGGPPRALVAPKLPVHRGIVVQPVLDEGPGEPAVVRLYLAAGAGHVGSPGLGDRPPGNGIWALLYDGQQKLLLTLE